MPKTRWYVVAEDAGELVAAPPRRTPKADVQTVAVRRDRQGTGIGDQLVEALLAEARHRAVNRVMLEVRDGNEAAQRLYARHGFTGLGRRRSYYGPGLDAVVMERPPQPLRVGDPVTEPLVLGIETSCDETGVGIVRGHTLLADAVASQRRGARALRWRRARGGLARPPRGDGADHRAGLRDAGMPARRRRRASRSPAGPGLAGALLVGVAAAKALAVGLGKPLYGVNHLAAHVAVDQLEHGPLPEPCLALLVCGGHSSLLRVERRHRSASSRSARPSTTRPARRSTRSPGCSACRSPAARTSTAPRATATAVAIDFPRGLTGRRDLERHRFDFSFSGLKTAVARWVEARETAGEPVPVADVAASFQEAVCDVLIRKAVDAAATRASRTS